MATNPFSQSRLCQLQVYTDEGGWTLDLSQSGFSRVPPALTNMADIQTLDLSDNPGLKRLPKEFRMLTKLRHLSLLRCDLRDFPRALVALSSLETLRLSLNNLERFPLQLDSMVNLKHLELVMCSLEVVPTSFTTLPSLAKMELQCNKLTRDSFPNSMRTLHSLRHLDLSNNNLDTVPECLCSLSGLETLNINRNYLKDLPKSISKLQTLKELHISHNQLKALPEELYALPELQSLHIDNNRLLVLSRSICSLPGLQDGDSFRANNNSLVSPPQDVCDQGLASIKDFFMNQKHDII